MIAEKYIITVEENSLATRTNIPHFITFKGEIFPLLALLDNQRQPIEIFVSIFFTKFLRGLFFIFINRYRVMKH
jgi:hypothetical protein